VGAPGLGGSVGEGLVATGALALETPEDIEGIAEAVRSFGDAPPEPDEPGSLEQLSLGL